MGVLDLEKRGLIVSFRIEVSKVVYVEGLFVPLGVGRRKVDLIWLRSSSEALEELVDVHGSEENEYANKSVSRSEDRASWRCGSRSTFLFEILERIWKPVVLISRHILSCDFVISLCGPN